MTSHHLAFFRNGGSGTVAQNPVSTAVARRRRDYFGMEPTHRMRGRPAAATRVCFVILHLMSAEAGALHSKMLNRLRCCISQPKELGNCELLPIRDSRRIDFFRFQRRVRELLQAFILRNRKLIPNALIFKYSRDQRCPSAELCVYFRFA